MKRIQSGTWLFEAIAPTIGDEAIGVGAIRLLLKARRNDERLVVYSKSTERFKRNFHVNDVCFRDSEIKLFSGGERRKCVRFACYVLLAVGIVLRLRRLALMLWGWCPYCNRTAYAGVEVASCVFFQGGPSWNREWLSIGSVLRRLFLVTYLRTLGLRVVYLGIAVGPFSRAGLRERVLSALAIRCLKVASAVVVRDERSLKELGRGFDRRLFRAPDFAFGIGESDGPMLPSIPANAVCINVRSVPPRYGIAQELVREKTSLLVNEVLEWARQSGKYVYFLSMNEYLAEEKDSACLEWVAGERAGLTVLDLDLTCQGLKALLPSFELVISVRMHLAILAVSQSVPCVLVGYTRKCRMFMDSIGMERYHLELANLKAGDVVRVAGEVHEAADRMRRSLGRQVTGLREELTRITNDVVAIAVSD